MSEKSDLLINENKLGSRQEPSNKQRRTFIGGTLAALAASPLLAIPRRAMAEQMDTPSDPFILLLTGVYQPVPVGGGPNLGLSAVNLGDGSYSVTKIYPIFGIGNEGGHIDQDHAIGNFYVQFAGKLCAYQLPGGAIAMRWGLIPYWAKDIKIGFSTINAMAETVDSGHEPSIFVRAAVPFPRYKRGRQRKATTRS
jgi:hypothetical protein